MNGKWWLALRSPVQASNGKDDYDNAGKLLLPALAPNERKAVLAYSNAVLAKLGSAK